MILVLSSEQDIHAQAVMKALQGLGQPGHLLDLSLFPEHVGLSVGMGEKRKWQAGFSYLDALKEKISITDCSAVWWRRPRHPVVSRSIASPSHADFAANECQEALAGLWYATEAYWINPPDRDATAHRKVYQLKTARALGIAIPPTLVTNEPETAKAFLDTAGNGKPGKSNVPRKVICKSFSATEQEWRETRVVGEEELANLAAVRYAPVIFQDYIEAEYDLRITVVGNELFAAAIHSQQTEYPIDCRMDIANAKIQPVELPAAVRKKLLELMQRLGLVYGAIDMRKTPEGEYVFLEINPAGQWLFIEQETGQPISQAVAENLASQGHLSAGNDSRAPACAVY